MEAHKQCPYTSPQIISPPGKNSPCRDLRMNAESPSRNQRAQILSAPARSGGKQQHKGGFVRVAPLPQCLHGPGAASRHLRPPQLWGPVPGARHEHGSPQQEPAGGASQERGAGFLERESVHVVYTLGVI